MIIGLLKIISLLILCVISLYCKLKKISIDGIKRNCGIYYINIWYIIPAVGISFYKQPLFCEIVVNWLCFEYCSSYTIQIVYKE